MEKQRDEEQNKNSQTAKRLAAKKQESSGVLKYCNEIFNFFLSLVFFVLTLLSIYAIQPQNLSFYSNRPVYDSMKKSKPLYEDFHYSIINDIMERFDSSFDIYRDIISGKEEIEYDLVPVTTLSLSLSLTAFKNCSSDVQELLNSTKNLCPNSRYLKDPELIKEYKKEYYNDIQQNAPNNSSYKILNFLNTTTRVHDIRKSYFLSYITVSYLGLPNTFAPVINFKNHPKFNFSLFL